MLSSESEKQIEEILHKCVDNTFTRMESKKVHKPFHEALLAEQIVKISSFERSFSTSFGQGAIENISKVIALDSGFKAQRQKEMQLNVYKGALDEIERICSSLRNGSARPNWRKELDVITAYTKGDTVVRRVISDLWIEKDGVESFISIKTVKPNLDQIEKAKNDMLLIAAGNSEFRPFVALYYNPYGEDRSDYNHSFAKKIFQIEKDECVLIGRDYWDFLGGEGTYEALLLIFAKVGETTKLRLLK